VTRWRKLPILTFPARFLHCTRLTCYYYYNDLGNVTRIVTHAAGSDLYDATRFGYARNRATVSFVLGETWTCAGEPCVAPTNYAVTYARQFRYDGARQRYLNRELDPMELQTSGTLGEVGSTWSDYDGDAIYGDRELIGGNLENTASYEPGIGRFSWADDGSGTWVPQAPSDTTYDRSDLIGTTRHLTDGTGDLDPVVYTAFGERIDGTNHRYGYAGAWGYQAHSFGEVSSLDPPLDPDTIFPYLHVGARYYDPATGRFLQRDPIGIVGGGNVYAYSSVPTMSADPDRLIPLEMGGVDWPARPKTSQEREGEREVGIPAIECAGYMAIGGLAGGLRWAIAGAATWAWGKLMGWL